MILPKHYKTSILITGLILITLTLWVIGWYILSDQARALKETAREITNTERRAEVVTDLKQKLSTSAESIELLNNIFINQDELVHFIEYLETQAVKSDVELETRNINIVDGEVTFELQLISNRNNLRQFFGQITQAPFLIRFDEISLRAIKSEALTDNWMGNIKISLISFVKED